MTSEVSIRSISPHHAERIELDVLDGTSAPKQEVEETASSIAVGSIGESESGVYASELPPVDRGIHAWGCLLGASLFEGMILGSFLNFINYNPANSTFCPTALPYSFGVFQNYYNSQEKFANNKSISVIGASGSGLSYLVAPFITQILAVYPLLRRKLMYLGLIICVTACIGASFANTVSLN